MVLVAAVALAVSACGSGLSGGPTGSASDAPTAIASATAGPAAPGAATAIPTDTPVPSAVPLVPLVPIVTYWSAQRTISRTDIALLLSGRRPTGDQAFTSLALAAVDAAPLASTLGVAVSPAVRLLSPAGVVAAVRASPATLGFIRAQDVSSDVRALSVDGASLFGAGRVKSVAAWPLDVTSGTPSTFDIANEWTLTAGGDVNLDRSVFVQTVTNGKGADYPWDGGTARIAGSSCCGYQGASLVVARRTGNTGAFRALLSASDLSIVNLEGPASVNFVHRADGFQFAVDPALLIGLRDAGIDAVSLANNHIRNAGDEGVIETCAKLDSIGVAHAGAGTTAAAASAPAMLSAGGLRVAFLAFDAQEPANWVAPGRAGAAPMLIDSVVADIKAARAAGANFVIVMPHWGVEYSEYISPLQRSEAAAMVAAGADVIIGSHTHVAGGMQTFTEPSGDQAFVVYSLGNLLFDFNHNEATQEGVIDDLTFIGTRLVQVDLHPTIMVDDSQVNLLDPAGAQRVLDRIRAASDHYLDW